MTSLDVSKNANLEYLACSLNQLTTLMLDTSENSALTCLNCKGNALAALNISVNTQFGGETYADPCLQERIAPLKEIGSGWLLDMAELVGSDNLQRIILGSGIPEMSPEGKIIFAKDALPDEINYEYVCTEKDHLSVQLTVKDKPKDPEQTEKVPEQTEKDSEQTENTSQHKTHSYGAFKTVKAPTALEEGTETRTCTVCGAAESRAVAKLKPTMELNATSIKLKTKQSTNKIKVSGLASGDEVASWNSSNPKVVTVNSNGKITAKSKKGKATITVTLKSGFSRDIKVNVQKNEVTCTKITLNKKSVTLKNGKSFTLKPTVQPITCIQKVTYSTSDSSVATVSSKGVIKAKKKGKVTITVKAGKKKVKCKVKVK